ncbi:MAG: site-2 protease family protein [bacterium]
MNVYLFIVALILFICLVVIHEFGHFIVARRNGVKVLEFGIGFPPKIWSKITKTGFIFSINALPLGGFVRLKGEHDADVEPGDFGAASTFAKCKIIAAGVLMNLLAAFVLLTILAWVGMPKILDNQFTVKSDTKIIADKVIVSYIEPNSPASESGIRQNDQLISIGKIYGPQKSLNGSQDLPNITKLYAGNKVKIIYKRGSNSFTKTTTLRTQSEVLASDKTKNPKGYFGIVAQPFILQQSTWSAPIVALGLIKQFTVLTFQGLWKLVSGVATGQGKKATSQVAGPLGIYFILQNGSELGYQFILFIIAVISLTLAIMNVLPIPALDGGRLFFILGARLFGKRLNPRTEDIINGVGFLALMGLIILITYVDYKRHYG